MKKRLSDPEFWSILRENSGLYARTASAIREKHGIPYTRQSVKERSERHPAKLQDILDETLDIAESELIDLMQSKNLKIKQKSVEFYLRTKGRDRGYVDRTEASVILKNSEVSMTKEQILAEIDRIDKILELKKP
jgi:hypothetical protein